MATPEYLRTRAMQAEIAGDNETADSLRAEADELENPTLPPEGAAPQ